LFGDTISIKVLHEGSGRVGSTRDNSLALWGDRFGLAFELRVPVTPAGAGLRAMVASGFDGMPINLIEIEDANYWRDETGHLCREVTKGKIDHIAIVRAGAYRSARCWFADTPPDHMPPEIASARRHWFLAASSMNKSALRSRVTMRYGASMDLFGYDLDNVADRSEICYSAKGALWACSPRLFSKTGWLARWSIA
jgi:hypothetical protein